MIPDCELLHQYAESRDEAAFAEVVRRQADLVYSVALRVTENAALAQDVTQIVFTKLAQQARGLGRYDTIVGWLHTTARHTAINAVRGEERRRAREQESALMQNNSSAPDVNWEQLRPILDEAVDTLHERDRKAVLLRFFKGLSHQEVGTTLGLSEEAARKRVERAVEKLRAHFARRGVTVSSALLAVAMSENSVQAAPTGLAAKVVPPSLAAAGAVGLGGAAGSAFLLTLFMSTKTKTILALAVVLIVAATLSIKLATTNEPSVAAVPVPVASTQIKSTIVPAASAPVEAPVVIPPAPNPIAPTVAQTAPATPTPVVPGTEIDVKPQTELAGAIAQAILICQAQDYLGLARIQPPGSLDKFTTNGSQASGDPKALALMGIEDPSLLSAEDHARGYAEALRHTNNIGQNMADHVQFLQSIQGQEPEMNADGTKATFRVNPKIGILDHLTFQKVDGYWYLAPR